MPQRRGSTQRPRRTHQPVWQVPRATCKSVSNMIKFQDGLVSSNVASPCPVGLQERFLSER
eukprot:903118-Amphidinium_carterae.1